MGNLVRRELFFSFKEMPSFILHLGVGSFHRAHQAFYLHRLRQLEADGGDASASWYLAAGQIRPDMNSTMTSLAAQNGKYTLETVNPRGERTYTRIESIKRIIAWTEENEELIAAGAETDCKIISFTGRE
jgi:D-arabinitol 4-dehydrogenase